MSHNNHYRNRPRSNNPEPHLARMMEDGSLDRAVRAVSVAYLLAHVTQSLFDEARDLLIRHNLKHERLFSDFNQMFRAQDRFTRTVYDMIRDPDKALQSLRDYQALLDIMTAYAHHGAALAAYDPARGKTADQRRDAMRQRRAQGHLYGKAVAELAHAIDIVRLYPRLAKTESEMQDDLQWLQAQAAMPDDADKDQNQ